MRQSHAHRPSTAVVCPRYDKIKKRRHVSVISADAWQNYLDVKAEKRLRPRKGWVGQEP